MGLSGRELSTCSFRHLLLLHPHPKHRCTTRRCHKSISLLPLHSGPVYGAHTIVEFGNDTAVTDLIRDEDESAHREEVDRSALWCEENNLLLSTNKTREIIINLLTPTHPYQQRGSREWDQLQILRDPQLRTTSSQLLALKW